MQKAYLVLEDGAVFEGVRIGATGEGLGPIVFTTGVVGYIETLTDPAYAGQIVLQTFPQIGNYGTIASDEEGQCVLAGYVVHELADAPSNFRTEGTLDDFLKQNGVPGIAGVDTRAITRRIRESGPMNAMITDTLPADMEKLRAHRVAKDAAMQVGVHRMFTLPIENKKFSVAVIDTGARKGYLKALLTRGCQVTLFPADVTADEVLASCPDGVFLPGGPGDPADCAKTVETVRALMGQVPMFGCELGHQLMALAMGGKTEVMPYGHRGSNQPVRDLATGRTHITAQNHGYVVSALPEGAEPTFQNANDKTVEGLSYPGKYAFSAQFFPDGSTKFLFDKFLDMMGGDR